MTTRILTSLTLALTLLSARYSIAQTVDVADKNDAKHEQVASAERLARAIADVERELEEFRAQDASEAAARNREIEKATQQVLELGDHEAELQGKLAAIDKETVELDDKLFVIRQRADATHDDRKAFDAELRNQSLELRDRFRTSIFGAEHPELVDVYGDLANSEEAIAPKTMADKLERFLGASTQALAAASEASKFTSSVQLADTSGTIADCDVLRLGLIAGYYHHAASDEAGLLKASGNEEGRMIGIAQGIEPERQQAIASFVDDPTAGGIVPYDVTGGSGVATLGVADDAVRWFEKGGAFMWPLLFVAIVALLMSLERFAVLLFRSRGLGRRIAHIVGLVERGELDNARQALTKCQPAERAVLTAAISHHSQPRSVMEDAVQEALLHVSPHFQKRLSFIALCAAISPLIGLLGTVTGMILTFQMVTVFGTSDPRFMAGGISEALITTQGGLYLAIPCLLSRGVLGAIADGALGRLETGAMSVVLALLKLDAKRDDSDVRLDLDSDDAKPEGDDARQEAAPATGIARPLDAPVKASRLQGLMTEQEVFTGVPEGLLADEDIEAAAEDRRSLEKRARGR